MHEVRLKDQLRGPSLPGTLSDCLKKYLDFIILLTGCNEHNMCVLGYTRDTVAELL